MPNIQERLAKLKGEGESKNRKKEETIPKVDRRKFNRGHPNSGRKPIEENLIKRGIKAYIEQYCDEDVEIKITDPKTGKSRVIKKPRAVAALERIFNFGMGVVEIGSPTRMVALKEFLDRSLGKSVQPLSNEGGEPFKLEVEYKPLLHKVYGSDDT